MNRYANKSEVVLALDEGGTVHSANMGSIHWLTKANGETARIRYSLWTILHRQRLIEKAGKEGRTHIWRKRAQE